MMPSKADLEARFAKTTRWEYVLAHDVELTDPMVIGYLVLKMSPAIEKIVHKDGVFTIEYISYEKMPTTKKVYAPTLAEALCMAYLGMSIVG